MFLFLAGPPSSLRLTVAYSLGLSNPCARVAALFVDGQTDLHAVARAPPCFVVSIICFLSRCRLSSFWRVFMWRRRQLLFLSLDISLTLASAMLHPPFPGGRSSSVCVHHLLGPVLACCSSCDPDNESPSPFAQPLARTLEKGRMPLSPTSSVTRECMR